MTNTRLTDDRLCDVVNLEVLDLSFATPSRLPSCLGRLQRLRVLYELIILYVRNNF